MKPNLATNLDRTAHYLLIGLLTLVPFYALLTVSIGSGLGVYEYLRLWPEVILAMLCLLAGLQLWRNNPDRQALQTNWLLWLPLVYAGLLVSSAVFTLIGGTVGAEAVLQGLVIDIRLPLAFLAAMILAPVVGSLRLRYLIVPGAVVVLTGLVLASVLPATSLQSIGYGADTIPAVTLVDQKVDYPRAQSTLRGPNPLGAYLVIVITALMALRFKKWSLKYSLPLAGLFLATSLVLAVTYSRSAYIGAALSLGLLLWWLLAKYRRFIYFGLAVLVVLAGVSLYFLRDNSTFQNVFFHTDDTSASSRSSNEDRASALQSGVRGIIANPLGSGVGSAGPASVHSEDGGRIAENYYLQIGQEVGVFGLIVFLAVNGLVLRRLWRLRKTDRVALILLASGIGLIAVNMLSHAWADVTLAYVWWLSAGWIVGSAILGSNVVKNKHETNHQA